MSNIEPTVTRTMRCPACSVVGTHTINASMANESVLCPTCAESGKRSACVVVTPIEPTEEQKQAANDYLDKHVHITISNTNFERVADDLARLLAEREAKLREELRGEWARLVEAREVTAMIVEGHQLRARVAELEASEPNVLLQRAYSLACNERNALAEREAQHLARIAEMEAKAANLDARLWDRCEDLARVGLERVHADAVHSKREAQHLADIKALHQFLGDHEEEEGIWIPRSEFKDVPCRKYLAHYDDAKADAPAVDWQAWANGSCPEPGCSLANPHEQGVACVKPTAEGGEG